MATITRKKLGERIKMLREDFGYSQEELAQKIKVSRPAISQIESGTRDVNSTELANIAGVFDSSVDALLEIYDEKGAQKKPKQEKGNIRISVPHFQKDKFKNIVLYILERCGAKPNVGETVLYKLLYFADFNFYEMYENQLTGATYRRIPHGPAPQEFTRIAEEMVKKNTLKKDTIDYFGKRQKRYLPLQKADLTKLQASEKEVIDKVIDQLSDLNATQISDYSHEDTPWKVTPEGDVISYELVFYRTPAYSVRTYSDEL